MATTGIVGHQPFANINITTMVYGFEELYDRIAIMYQDGFKEKDYDDVNDYTKASENPLGYLRLGFRLLQECSSHGEWMPRTWGLLPAASFSVVQARFTGPRIMYGLFHMAHQKKLNEEGEYQIPRELVFNGLSSSTSTSLHSFIAILGRTMGEHSATLTTATTTAIVSSAAETTMREKSSLKRTITGENLDEVL